MADSKAVEGPYTVQEIVKDMEAMKSSRWISLYSRSFNDSLAAELFASLHPHHCIWCNQRLSNSTLRSRNTGSSIKGLSAIVTILKKELKQS